MNDNEDILRTKIIEAILEYFEGQRSVRSVLALGITANSKSSTLKNIDLINVATELNFMGNQIAEGKSYSREYIKETFTSMLEKLTKN